MEDSPVTNWEESDKRSSGKSSRVRRNKNGQELWVSITGKADV